jgi:hypothetical protein
MYARRMRSQDPVSIPDVLGDQAPRRHDCAQPDHRHRLGPAADPDRERREAHARSVRPAELGITHSCAHCRNVRRRAMPPSALLEPTSLSPCRRDVAADPMTTSGHRRLTPMPRCARDTRVRTDLRRQETRSDHSRSRITPRQAHRRLSIQVDWRPHRPPGRRPTPSPRSLEVDRIPCS